MHYKAIVSRHFSLLLILFLTKSATNSPDSVSSDMNPKYLTLECSLICISSYLIFSFLTFFIFNLVAKSIDLVLSSPPEWILSLSSQIYSKSLFSFFLFYFFSISVISLCRRTRHVSLAQTKRLNLSYSL